MGPSVCAALTDSSLLTAHRPNNDNGQTLFIFIIIYIHGHSRMSLGAGGIVCMNFSIPAPFRLCCYNYTALLRPVADDYKYFSAQGAAEQESIVIMLVQSVGAETALVMNSTFGSLFVCGVRSPFLLLRPKKGIAGYYGR